MINALLIGRETIALVFRSRSCVPVWSGSDCSTLRANGSVATFSIIGIKKWTTGEEICEFMRSNAGAIASRWLDAVVVVVVIGAISEYFSQISFLLRSSACRVVPFCALPAHARAAQSYITDSVQI